MKFAFLFLGLLAASLSWWWLAYRHTRGVTSRSIKNRLLTSVIAGVAVYFGLLLLGVAYLAITGK